LSIILIIKVSSAEGDGTIKVYGKKVTPLWTNCGVKSV
jgi:hypothetical protein